jgi:poly(3-hydroxybutyrate) depolymerase
MREAVLMCVLVGAAVGADVTPHADVAGPAPLLVVLHGNNETGAERAKKWRAAAAKRGWQLLALDCPRDLGCDDEGRWYAWNGNPSWVREQVVAHAARERIDMTRVFLAGWSGGATYIGKRMPAWSSIFAGAVIHGGGVPPSEDECPDRAFPMYFLVGDENPAHGGSVRLRSYAERCGLDVRWDLLPGANHSQEDAVLTPEKADGILRWLERHRGADAVS